MSAPKRLFAAPQDVEAAFYEALERGDLEAMMAVWAEDEDVVCVHPGGPRLVGYAAVREAWRLVFENGARLNVRIARRETVSTPFAVVCSLIEYIQARGREDITAPVAATNVYVRSGLGWRMVAHHASPIPPDSALEAPPILH